MAECGTPIGDYLALLPDQTEESRFLRSIPWVLDAGRQDAEVLIRDLRAEAPRLAAMPHAPVFSLLTPMYNTPPRLLRELILSIRCQSWPHWELILVDDGSPKKEHLDIAREWANRDPRIKLVVCDENRGISGARNVAIEHATGDFFAIMDHDDILHPMALGTFARAVNADPGLNFLFTNECQINDEGTRTYGYFYKPHFDLFTLLRANYVCHFTAIRRDLLMAARRDGRVFRSEYDGAEDHDLFARVAITGQMKSLHIPLFLYYWRAVPTSCSMSLAAKPEIPERRLCLLDELLPQIYPGATFRFASPDPMRYECHLTIRIRSIEHQTKPSLLVVIPFRDDPVRLLKALDGLERQHHDLDLSVVLMDGGSEECGTASALSDWLAKPRQNRYDVAPPSGPYHHARLYNAAVARFGREKDLVLFLDHDIELKSPEALQTMAMQLLADPNCGVVGLRLMGPEPLSFRHAGVRIHETADGSGYGRVGPVRQPREFICDEHVVLAVSLACAMTRRETFDTLGGLDEIILSTAYVDLDYCAKAIEAGYRSYYFGTLAAVQHGPDRLDLPPNREFELAALQERHARTLATWRLRILVHAVDPIWPIAPTSVEPAEPRVVEVPVSGPKPMRYKMVDSLNSGLKRFLGPAHGILKSGVSGSLKMTRRLRGRRSPVHAEAIAGQPIYRPMFARKRRARSEVHASQV